MAFRGDSTATYTYATNSTGGTVDLGARNNYRYVNATNVYNKGKSDGEITTPIGITLISSPATVNIGDILVYMCYASPSIIEINLTISGVTLIDRVTNGNTDLRIYQATATSVSFSLQYPSNSMITKLDY